MMVVNSKKEMTQSGLTAKVGTNDSANIDKPISNFSSNSSNASKDSSPAFESAENDPSSLDPMKTESITEEEKRTTDADQDESTPMVPSFVSTDPILVLESTTQMGSGEETAEKPERPETDNVSTKTSWSMPNFFTTDPDPVTDTSSSDSGNNGASSNDPTGDSGNNGTSSNDPTGDSGNNGASSNDPTSDSGGTSSAMEVSESADEDDDKKESSSESSSSDAPLLTSLADLPSGLHQVYVKPSFWLKVSVEAIGRVVNVAAPTTYIYCAFDDIDHGTRKQLLALHEDKLLSKLGLTYTESSAPALLANKTLEATEHGMWLTFKPTSSI
jgi:hypothetical protein